MTLFLNTDTFTTDKVLELIALEGYDTSLIHTTHTNTLYVHAGIGNTAIINVGDNHVHFTVENASLDYTFIYKAHNTAIFGRALRKWVADLKDLNIIINRTHTDVPGF